MVVGPAEIVALHVGREEARVPDDGCCGILFGRLYEVFRTIDADRMAIQSDQLGNLDRAVAEPAADVEHPVTGAK